MLKLEAGRYYEAVEVEAVLVEAYGRKPSATVLSAFMDGGRNISAYMLAANLAEGAVEVEVL
jgi:hypothetical protein